MGESVRTRIARDIDAMYGRFDAAKRKLWHRLRRHGWRIERCEPGIDWYRGDDFINVWFDWLDGMVEIEQGKWANWPVMGGFIVKKFIGKRQRVSFEDFEKGNYRV